MTTSGRIGKSVSARLEAEVVKLGGAQVNKSSSQDVFLNHLMKKAESNTSPVSSKGSSPTGSTVSKVEDSTSIPKSASMDNFTTVESVSPPILRELTQVVVSTNIDTNETTTTTTKSAQVDEVESKEVAESEAQPKVEQPTEMETTEEEVKKEEEEEETISPPTTPHLISETTNHTHEPTDDGISSTPPLETNEVPTANSSLEHRQEKQEVMQTRDEVEAKPSTQNPAPPTPRAPNTDFDINSKEEDEESDVELANGERKKGSKIKERTKKRSTSNTKKRIRDGTKSSKTGSLVLSPRQQRAFLKEAARERENGSSEIHVHTPGSSLDRSTVEDLVRLLKDAVLSSSSANSQVVFDVETRLFLRIGEDVEKRLVLEKEVEELREELAAEKKENQELKKLKVVETDWSPETVFEMNRRCQEMSRFLHDVILAQRQLQQKSSEFQTYLGHTFSTSKVAVLQSSSLPAISSASSPEGPDSPASPFIRQRSRPLSGKHITPAPLLPGLSSALLPPPSNADAVMSQLSETKNPTFDDSPKGKILRELIETERAYVRDLALTIKFYLEPLRTVPFLKAAEHTTIFSNIELIFPIHISILQKLENNEQNVGTVFVQMAEFFKMYTQYCNNHPASTDTLKKLVKNSTGFANSIEETRLKNEELCRLDLPSYLIKPIQRLCKYPLLMEQLKRTTDKNDDDYADLDTAVKKINEIVSLVNSEKNVAENQTRLVSLNETILFSSKDVTSIVAPGRIIVKEGTMKAVNEKGKRITTVFVLFNDAIMVLRKSNTMSNKKYRCETYFNLDNAYFATEAPDEDKQTAFKMNMINRKQTYVFVAKSQGERDSWIAEINSCIAKLLAAQEPADEEITFIGEGKKKNNSVFTSFTQKSL